MLAKIIQRQGTKEKTPLDLGSLSSDQNYYFLVNSYLVFSNLLSTARVLNSTIPRCLYPPRSIAIELRSVDCSVTSRFPAISRRFTDRFVKFN
jgi:hypothetical protein